MARLKNFNAFSCSFWKEKQLPTALGMNLLFSNVLWTCFLICQTLTCNAFESMQLYSKLPVMDFWCDGRIGRAQGSLLSFWLMVLFKLRFPHLQSWTFFIDWINLGLLLKDMICVNSKAASLSLIPISFPLQFWLNHWWWFFLFCLMIWSWYWYLAWFYVKKCATLIDPIFKIKTYIDIMFFRFLHDFIGDNRGRSIFRNVLKKFLHIFKKKQKKL